MLPTYQDLAATLDAALRAFPKDTAGSDYLRTGLVRTEQVTAWRKTAEQARAAGPAMPDYSAWHAIQARRDENLRNGLCQCCATVEGRQPGKAVARWENRNGAVDHICAPCLDKWLRWAKQDEDLRPLHWDFLPGVRIITVDQGISQADADRIRELVKIMVATDYPR